MNAFMTKPSVMHSFESPKKEEPVRGEDRARELEVRAKQQRIQKAVMYEQQHNMDLVENLLNLGAEKIGKIEKSINEELDRQRARIE
jgi:hypothetical protein